MTEIADTMRSDERTAVHHACDSLQALRNLDVVHRRVDVREGAEYAVRFQAALEWRVLLRVESLGLGHATGHPQQDEGVGLRLNLRSPCNCFGSRPSRAASVAPAD